MKKFIINKCMKYIKKYNLYDDIKLAEIKYGLEGLYMTISKFLIISTVAIILGIFKESLIFTLFYNILRIPSFGIHATKSWICLITSLLLFIGIPYLCIFIKIPIIIKAIICSVGICLMLKNSPADTYKRPIINKKRRLTYKYISTIFTIILSFFSVLIQDNFISNSIMFAIIVQNCMISPLTYKIFKLPYNNYINYLKLHPELQS